MKILNFKVSRAIMTERIGTVDCVYTKDKKGRKHNLVAVVVRNVSGVPVYWETTLGKKFSPENLPKPEVGELV